MQLKLRCYRKSFQAWKNSFKAEFAFQKTVCREQCNLTYRVLSSSRGQLFAFPYKRPEWSYQSLYLITLCDTVVSYKLAGIPIMKFNTGLVVLIVLCVIVILEAYPMINGNIDYVSTFLTHNKNNFFWMRPKYFFDLIIKIKTICRLINSY